MGGGKERGQVRLLGLNDWMGGGMVYLNGDVGGRTDSRRD